MQSFIHVFKRGKQCNVSVLQFVFSVLLFFLLVRKTVNLDSLFIHSSEVKGLVWVVNKGQLLSMCADDCIYLLDIKQREVEVVQFIQWSKEHITSLNLAVNSSWVFVGTDRGNTHVLRLCKMIYIKENQNKGETVSGMESIMYAICTYNCPANTA